ncbi:SDR family NAD(P)-dependent oxidoreductase [Paenibacillus lautus]
MNSATLLSFLHRGGDREGPFLHKRKGARIMNLDLQGKVALVTGSTSGIGKAIAMSLAAEGASVIINGRHEDKVKQTIHDIRAVHPDAELRYAVMRIYPSKKPNSGL